jgi:ubiquinone/menaquinone biosynthesis C-methylase UbiE
MTTASERFGRIASNFVTSEVHSAGPSIAHLHELLSGHPIEAVCDVACGAGHLALSFSGKAARIVAVDPAPKMLAAVRKLAAAKGCEIETHQAFAEAMPFVDGHFDVVMSRLAPHHFADLRLCLKEMGRILKVGGLLSIIDLEGNDDPTLDDFNHRLEVLHDPTHVRSYTARSWRAVVEQIGFRIVAFEVERSEKPGGVTVHRWCEITNSGEKAEAEIMRLLSNADCSVLDRLGICRENGTFLMPIRTVILVAQKIG